MSRNNRNAINNQFVPHTRKMLESFAYRTLSRAAHQILARIEIEHLSHGGKENGRLPVTYDDFEEYGTHRHSIAPAIRESVALGFLKVTEHGCAGNREFRSPNKFELTYVPVKHAHGHGTNEWRFIESIEQARAIASLARRKTNIPVKPPNSVTKRRGQKQKSSDDKRPASVVESGTSNHAISGVNPTSLQ
jgi:hypothetical protein